MNWFKRYCDKTTEKRIPHELLAKARVLFLEIGSQLEVQKVDDLLNRVSDGLPAKYLESVEVEKEVLSVKRKYGSLLQVCQAISGIFDLEQLLKAILDSALTVTGAERGFLFLYENGRLEAKLGRGMESEELPREDWRFSQTLVRQVEQSREPILTTDAQADPRFHLEQSVQLQGLRSVLCVPLTRQDRFLGILYLDNRLVTHLFSEEERDLLKAFASQAAISLENAQVYRELDVLTKSLEQRVQDRTHELEMANVRLKELDRLKSSFLSVASHELRTPLTSIRGYLENLIEGITGPLNEKQRRYLIRTRENVDRLVRLINELLDLNRIEAGKVDLNIRSVELNEVIQETIDGFQAIAQKKGIAIDSSLQDKIASVFCDRDKLAQILMNLVQNALNHTSENGTIRVEANYEDSGFVNIKVVDTGRGIEPENVPKIFDKFFRGSTQSQDRSGWGLGLSITKSLVELHGGTIRVDSTLGQGSTFTFTLPGGKQTMTREA